MTSTPNDTNAAREHDAMCVQTLEGLIRIARVCDCESPSEAGTLHGYTCQYHRALNDLKVSLQKSRDAHILNKQTIKRRGERIDTLTRERESLILVRQLARTIGAGWNGEQELADFILENHTTHCARIDELLAEWDGARATSDELGKQCTARILQAERDFALRCEAEKQRDIARDTVAALLKELTEIRLRALAWKNYAGDGGIYNDMHDIVELTANALTSNMPPDTTRAGEVTT